MILIPVKTGQKKGDSSVTVWRVEPARVKESDIIF